MLETLNNCVKQIQGTCCANMAEIQAKEIEIEKEPFARGGTGKVHMAKLRNEDVVVKVIKVDNEEEKQAVKREVNLTLRPVSYTHLTLPTKRIV